MFIGLYMRDIIMVQVWLRSMNQDFVIKTPKHGIIKNNYLH